MTQLISDEKRREQFWIVAAEEANQANAAKSAFLSRMSHDIRTPMNVIMGLVSIAQNHLGDPDRVRDSLEKIQTTGRNLQQLVNDVLDNGQTESGEFKIRPYAYGSQRADRRHSGDAAVYRPGTGHQIGKQGP